MLPAPAQDCPDREPDLIARVQAGDQAAFETIFDCYAAKLIAFARARLQSRELAEEVVQGLFFAIWHRWVKRATLLLNREDVAALWSLDKYIDAVEAAFMAYAQGRTLAPALMHVDGVGGEFHVKAGGVTLGTRTYVGLGA